MTPQHPSCQSRPPGRRLAWYARLFVIFVVAFTLAGCSGAPVSTDQLSRYEQIQASCDSTAQLATSDDQDVSGSRRELHLAGQDRQAVEDDVVRTALCGGHFKLDVFSASSAADDLVIDTDLALPGATKIAQARRVPKLLAATMAEIDKRYPAAVDSVTAGGTDVVSRIGAAKQYLDQLNASRAKDEKPFALRLTVLTDGIDYRVANRMSPAQAKALADTLSLPKLPASTRITFAGLGKVSGEKPDTGYVDELIAFYDEIGARTGTGHTTAVTDYSADGGDQQ
jgi:hypothetical protein